MAAVLLLVAPSSALRVCGLDIAHAKPSPASRSLDGYIRDGWPSSFPYSRQDLTPLMAGNDRLFYLMPKLVQHAGEECRAALTDFYAAVLPQHDGDVLDLCSSWTSHYPAAWKGRRVVALGLNPIELMLNPSKTEWRVQDLNSEPKLPFDDGSFEVITNSLSVDYLTKPVEVFAEMARVLKPGGVACCAFTNRCFPTKVVPIWTKPFTEENHARIVGSYFHYSSPLWAEIGVADVSPDGWAGQRDPAVVVIGRKC
ncbi:hypothetical protein AB1Y20_023515 [Prymnesium parvum]|uniref:Methyltransferase type 11 domain-containing protein n=1 Tax=Prymnesium parvum TaxID=97485 RepID=A0AB34JEZ5_PRYPA